MPVTRSSSKDHSARREPFARDLKNRQGATTSSSMPDANVICIDDSDDSNPPPKKTSTVRSRYKAKAIPSTTDIVEVSSESDEGDPARTINHNANRTVKSLHRQIKNLKDENDKLKVAAVHDRARAGNAEAKIAQLTADIAQLQKNKATTDFSALEDHVSCEICIGKMWAPYTLPECGHTFCQSCLVDWFSTTLTQHMAAHPNWNVQPQMVAHLQELLRNPQLDLRVRQQLEVQLAGLRQPLPPYTCPTCREPVKHKPIEVFVLKHVVRSVAGALGEKSPQKDASYLKQRKARLGDGPWDGFFPSG